MALTFRHLILPAVLVCFGVSIANAQAAPRPDTFRVVSLGPTEPLRYDVDPRTTNTVDFPTTTYSRPYPIPLDGELSLYRLVDNPDPKLPPAKIIVAQLRLPPRSSGADQPPTPRVIILVPAYLLPSNAPRAPDGGPLEFLPMVLDDSASTHPADHLRVISFSRRPSAVMFGAKSTTLDPFKSAVIPYPETYRTKLQVATLVTGQWRPIVSSTQMLARDTRLTLFLIDPPPTEDDPAPVDLRLRKIAEVLPPSASN